MYFAFEINADWFKLLFLDIISGEVVSPDQVIKSVFLNGKQLIIIRFVDLICTVTDNLACQRVKLRNPHNFVASARFWWSGYKELIRYANFGIHYRNVADATASAEFRVLHENVMDYFLQFLLYQLNIDHGNIWFGYKIVKYPVNK